MRNVKIISFTFNNFFTSYSILVNSAARKLRAIGTVRSNRTESCSFGVTKEDERASRSSHRRCSVKKGVLRSFAKFTRKHLCQSLFFNEVADLRPATLLKKRLRHRCFPVNFAKFLRTPLLQNTSRRLVLCFL